MFTKWNQLINDTESYARSRDFDFVDEFVNTTQEELTESILTFLEETKKVYHYCLEVSEFAPKANLDSHPNLYELYEIIFTQLDRLSTLNSIALEFDMNKRVESKIASYISNVNEYTQIWFIHSLHSLKHILRLAPDHREKMLKSVYEISQELDKIENHIYDLSDFDREILLEMNSSLKEYQKYYLIEPLRSYSLSAFAYRLHTLLITLDYFSSSENIQYGVTKGLYSVITNNVQNNKAFIIHLMLSIEIA